MFNRFPSFFSTLPFSTGASSFVAWQVNKIFMGQRCSLALRRRSEEIFLDR